MRKLVILSFISLDGIIQGPGGPHEDPRGGFKHGGWAIGYFDDLLTRVMVKQMSKKLRLAARQKNIRDIRGTLALCED